MNLADMAASQHKAAQQPWELSLTLDLLTYTIRPRVILEIGSWYGGSLFAWASTGADVLAYTLPETRDALDGNSHGATVLYGNSHDDEAYGRIMAALDGRPLDFAFIDGDHSEEGCRADFELCRALGARVTGFHDITGIGDPGVAAVWGEVKAKYAYVEIVRPSRTAVGTGIAWT